MAKKNKIEQKQRYCGECALSTWTTEFRHKDLKGNPICVTCPNSEFYRLRDEYACKEFKPKTIQI